MAQKEPFSKGKRFIIQVIIITLFMLINNSCSVITSLGTKTKITILVEPENAGNVTYKSYDNSRKIIITATPSYSYIFDHWEGGFTSKLQEVYIYDEDYQKTGLKLTAHFRRDDIPVPTSTIAGHEGDRIYNIGLEIHDSYPSITNNPNRPNFPPKLRDDYTPPIMYNLGLNIVGSDQRQDGTLILNLVGKAIGANYEGGYQYAGAQYTGNVEFVEEGQTIFNFPIDYLMEPPEYFKTKFGRYIPQDAPFVEIYQMVFYQTAMQIWGPQALIRNWEDWTSWSYFPGKYCTCHDPTWCTYDSGCFIDESLEKLINSLGENAVPDLIGALKSSKIKTRLYALFALQNIGKGANNAVPDIIAVLKDEDYKFVEASFLERLDNKGSFISDRRIKNTAADALIQITGQNFGTDAEAWEKWWQSK
jgi:hypothetical protein